MTDNRAALDCQRGAGIHGTRRNYRVLQAGRGLAALAVVGFHANRLCGLPKYFGREPAALFRAGSSGVDFFFVLSGLVMVLAHRADLGQPRSVLSFVWKRCRRIYPPLWVVLCVILILRIALPGLAPGGSPHADALINAFAAGPVVPEIEPLLGVEWTLRCEMLFYALFAVMLWRWRPGLTVIAAWLALSLASAFVPMPFPWLFLFSPLYVLFGMGMVVAWRVLRAPNLPGHLVFDWLFMAVGAMLFAATWGAVVVSPAVRDSDLTPWCYGLGASSLMLGLIALERRGALVVPAALTALGDASYSIYLVHFVVISAATKLAMAINRQVPMWVGAWWLVIVATGTLAGFIFHGLVERPLLRRFASPPKLICNHGSG
ncbi:MAG: acyltransferase [Pseudomonadota bacterium]|nr:acyltransferase [Pseudomonadota bacterium]